MEQLPLPEFQPEVTSSMMSGPSTVAFGFCLLLLAMRFAFERQNRDGVTARTFITQFLRWITPRMEPLGLFTLSLFFSIALSLYAYFPDRADHSTFFIATTAGLFLFFGLIKLAFLLLSWPGTEQPSHVAIETGSIATSRTAPQPGSDPSVNPAPAHTDPEASHG